MISQEELLTQIKGLEAQLDVLKAQIGTSETPKKRRSFGSLYGVFAGKADSSEEEIEAALYRLEDKIENLS